LTLIGKSSLEENHEINQRSRDIKKYFDIPHCTKPPCALPCVFSCPVQMICLRPALSNSTPGRKTSKRSGCVMLSSGLDFHTPGFNIASTLKLSKYNAHLNLQESHFKKTAISNSSSGGKQIVKSLQIVFCFGTEIPFLLPFFGTVSNHFGASKGLVLRLATALPKSTQKCAVRDFLWRLL